jgi:hypothetical protein
MNHYSLRLPEDLMTEVHRLAKENQVSMDHIDQWLLAIAEKAEAARTRGQLCRYDTRANYQPFDETLARVAKGTIAEDEL